MELRQAQGPPGTVPPPFYEQVAFRVSYSQVVRPSVCSDRNQESGIPAGMLLRNGPCQVRFRNSRFQELPRGVPWLGYFQGTSQYAEPGAVLRSGGQYVLVTVGKKIVARTGMGPRNDPFLASTTHATCGKSSTGSSRTFEKMKCCGQKYWDLTPSRSGQVRSGLLLGRSLGP